MYWSVIYQLIKVDITLIFTDCEHLVNFVVTFMRDIKGNSTSHCTSQYYNKDHSRLLESIRQQQQNSHVTTTTIININYLQNDKVLQYCMPWKNLLH